MTGRVHSFQSLGTVDGPGIRYVVFMQGCNLRCGCCHNPDTWDMNGGTEYTAEEILSKVLRFREYFGEKGGITISGGEPLLQADFCKELFRLCHENGINTCLDTSGSIMNDSVKELLSHTDRVLLDIKYTEESLYKDYVGCSMAKPLEFLEFLNEKKIPVTLRQVIIPTINDNEKNIDAMRKIIQSNPCIDKTELLAFRKICQVKYDDMGIEFPFKDITVPDNKLMKNLTDMINAPV